MSAPPPSPLPRRTSASYKHLKSNNLVTNSPFKSQIPTSIAPPSPIRKVSAEKRPRPLSLHEQAENERPLAFKRERKQSRVFQGLLEKEPVTKSPFRRIQADPIPPQDPHREPIDQPEFSPQKLLPTPAAQRTTPNSTPTKSALVSKRLHGPRLSGTSRQKRAPRKTVTWNEDCDVVEFDRESESEGERVFEDSVDDYAMDELDAEDGEDNVFFQTPPSAHSDDSYENQQDAQIDPETSITSLVDEMLGSRNATPEPSDSLPPDMETEDGVPLGRSHHAERNAERQGRPLPSPQGSPFAHRIFDDDKEPTTPPLQALSSPPSSPPLGRTTHAERAQAARNEERSEDRPAGIMPPSPSPVKKRPSHNEYDEDEFIPKLDLSMSHGNSAKEAVLSATETFANFCSELDTSTTSDLDLDASFASCHERSLSHEQRHSSPSWKRGHRRVASIAPLSPKPRSNTGSPSTPRGGSPLSAHATSFGSPSQRVTSPLGRPSPSFARVNSPGSPINRSGSPLIHGRTSSPFNVPRSGTGSPCARLDREELKRRMLLRQSRSQEDVSGRLTPAETSFGLDAEHDVFSKDEESFITPDNSRMIDSDVVQEVENAVIETVTVEKLATGTVAVSALEMSASYDSAQEDGDMDIDQPQEPAPEVHDFLAQAARQFATEAKKSRIPRLQSGSPPHPVPPPLDPEDEDEEADDSQFGRLNADLSGRLAVPGSSETQEGSRSTRASVGDMDVDMEMQSALDRLMEDVAGGNVQPDESFDKPEESFNNRSSRSFVSEAFKSPPMSRTVSATSVAITPPSVPEKNNSHVQVKDTQRLRAEFLANRRQARRAQAEEDSMDPDEPIQDDYLGVGRPTRRRSMSTGDAEEIQRRVSGGLLRRPSGIGKGGELGEIINRELERLEDDSSSSVDSAKKEKSKYQIRERQVIYASSDGDRVSHMPTAGDVNTGKAWKAVRRPSDMNEYSRQIKELRAMEKPGKSHGKVFVRVLGVKGLDVPLPSQKTLTTCTLNNGIHYVTTPEFLLAQDSHVDQEFELIEHSKLEFTLTLKVKRDPHIINQFKALAPSPSSAPAPPPLQPASTSKASSSSRGGMLSFFSSSPKKSKEKLAPPPTKTSSHQSPSQGRLPENLARYLKPDGTLARAFISFKDVAHRCDSRLFETTFPLIGQKLDLGNKITSQPVGEITLQLFRLPPLPGLPQDKLPQSLEECHRGLRHVNWHKVTYFEGTLTQSGGDCATWRRRQFRLIGAKLVAFNDVTKRATASIDLKKVEIVEDDQPHSSLSSPQSMVTGRSYRNIEDYEGLYGVERSFRLIFNDSQEIAFFADTDEEKARWLEILRALVGRIPPHPLWAEMLWQRQSELNQQRAAPLTPTGQSRP